MLTYKLWESTYCQLFNSSVDYLLAIIGSIFTIPLDILLFPLEILAFIIYKIVEKE